MTLNSETIDSQATDFVLCFSFSVGWFSVTGKEKMTVCIIYVGISDILVAFSYPLFQFACDN